MPGTHYALTAGMVPTADGTLNDVASAVIGNKTDTAINTKDNVSSQMRYLKGLMDGVGISSGGSRVLATGTFTTSSATVPADTGRAEATDYWKGCWLIPIAGAIAYQPRLITSFTVTTGVFTLDAEQPFTAVPGLVAYAILSPNSQLVPAADAATNTTPAHVIGNKSDAAVSTVGTVASIIAYIKGLLGGVILSSKTAAFKLLAGNQQTFTKQITSAANAGAVTVATITTQACKIKSLVVRSNGATTADLTSIAVTGGASNVVTFIDSTTGLRANIAAADQQVSWLGRATFAATKTIIITLTGTGATAVDLQVDVEYESIVDGGYLA